jgi:hypothetical protein
MSHTGVSREGVTLTIFIFPAKSFNGLFQLSIQHREIRGFIACLQFAAHQGQRAAPYRNYAFPFHTPPYE